GLNRLQVGGTDYVPALPTTNLIDTFQVTGGTVVSGSFSAFTDIPSLTLNFTSSGGPVEASANLLVLNQSSAPMEFRFVVDGVPQTSYYRQENSGQQWQQLHM